MNKYKAAMQDERFDEGRLDELCEFLRDYDESRSAPTPKSSARKLRIPVILAAALIVSVLCCTTIVAADAGIFDLGAYLAGVRERWELSGNVPLAADTSEYANELNISADSDNENPIDPKITTIIGDGHRVWIEIQVDTNNLDMPADIPDIALFGFRTDSADLMRIDNMLPRVEKQESGIYTFVYDIRDAGVNSHWFTGKIKITLKDFGYFVNDKFTALVKDNFTFVVTEDMLYSVGLSTKRVGPKKIKGAMIELELSPIALTFYGNYSELKALGLYDDKYFLDQPNVYEFHLSNGEVLKYYEDETGEPGGLYGLVISMDGGYDVKSDVSIWQHSFSAPIDIKEVKAVVVHGVRFELDDKSLIENNVSSNQINDIESYFDSIKNRHFKHGADVIVDKNLEKYVSQKEVHAVSNSNSNIDPKISAVISDGHRAWIQITVDAKDLSIPSDLPANTLFGFEHTDDEISFMNRIPYVMKQDSGVYVLTYDLQLDGDSQGILFNIFDNGKGMRLKNFGYSVNEKFTVLAEGEYSFAITEDMLNTVKDYTKVCGLEQAYEYKFVRSAMLDVKVTPLAVTFRGSCKELKRTKLINDKYYLLQPSAFNLILQDDVELKYSEGLSEYGFIAGALYDLLMPGPYSNFDTDTDIAEYRFQFNVPIDVDKIQRITLHGTRFILDKPDEQNTAEDKVYDICSYFDSYKNKHFLYSDKINVSHNKEKYANEVDIAAVPGNSGSRITPKITSIVGDRHRVWIQITVDASNLDIPDDLPANTYFGFRRDKMTPHNADSLQNVIKQSDNVYVFTYGIRDVGNGADGLFTGEAEILLEDFGYFIRDEFTPLEKGKYTFIIPDKMLDTVENSKKVSEAKQVMGATLELELSPIALVVHARYSELVEFGLFYDKYFLDQPNVFEFYMRDGRVLRYYDNDKNDVDGLYDLFIGMDGAGSEETDTAIYRHIFTVPIDVDEVEAITVHGVRFEF